MVVRTVEAAIRSEPRISGPAKGVVPGRLEE